MRSARPGKRPRPEHADKQRPQIAGDTGAWPFVGFGKQERPEHPIEEGEEGRIVRVVIALAGAVMHAVKLGARQQAAPSPEGKPDIGMVEVTPTTEQHRGPDNGEQRRSDDKDRREVDRDVAEERARDGLAPGGGRVHAPIAVMDGVHRPKQSPLVLSAMGPVLKEVPDECVHQGRGDDPEERIVISRWGNCIQEAPSTEVREQTRPAIDDEPERSDIEREDRNILGPTTDTRTGLGRAEHLDHSDDGSDDSGQSNCRQDGDCNQHGEKLKPLATSAARQRQRQRHASGSRHEAGRPLWGSVVGESLPRFLVPVGSVVSHVCRPASNRPGSSDRSIAGC
jgi:hypothetical protein